MLEVKHKPAEGFGATCSVLPGDYSGHRAEKINRINIRFNTYYLEIDSDLEPFPSEKCNGFCMAHKILVMAGKRRKRHFKYHNTII